jgi:O-antigen/teichoic acid export membrane protein
MENMQILFSKLAKKLKNLWRDSEDTGSLVVRGAVLLFSSRIAIKAIQFVRTVILARLLFPDDFGLFGIAAVTIGFADTLFQSGLNSAIIREKGNVEKYLDSVWTVNIIRNTLLALIIFFCAPLAGAFFNNEAIIPFVRVLALVTFIIGFENIGIVLLQKEMRFGRKILLDVSIIILEVVSVIFFAFVLRNAWALVFGSLANRIFAVVLSYVFLPYRPRFEWRGEFLRHLFSYGKWVWFMSIMGYFVAQGDNLIIGKMLTPADLGVYSLAFALALLPAVEVGRVVGNVLFPLFSKIQDDEELLRRAFIRISRVIFAITLPASFGLLALAPEIVANVYGERWLGMVPILSVLIFYGLIKSFEYIASPFFMGVGKPKISSFSLFSQFAVMFVFIVPLTFYYDVKGTAFAVLLGGIAAQTVLLFAMRREIHLGFQGFGAIGGISLASALFMYTVIIETKSFFPVVGVSGLLLSIFYGALVYAVALFALDFLFGKKMYNSLIWIKKSL